jgi:diguanylate cyclase (GGDEF)-like protein
VEDARLVSSAERRPKATVWKSLVVQDIAGIMRRRYYPNTTRVLITRKLDLITAGARFESLYEVGLDMEALEEHLIKIILNLDQGSCLIKNEEMIFANDAFNELVNRDEIPALLKSALSVEGPWPIISGGRFYSATIVMIDQIYSVLLLSTKKEFGLSNDPLTGLLHRECFDRLANKLMDDARSLNKIVSFLFIDLDGFKSVNDNWGHENGDIVLKKCSERILHVIRSNDLCFRFGGDEFVVILTEVKEKMHTCLVARRLISAISESISLDSTTNVRVGASIGIACYPFDGQEVEELVNKADEAMYHAKRLGKNNYQLHT